MEIPRYRLTILTGSHFVNDMLNGLMVAILPLLGILYHLSYTQVAVLILVNGVSSGLLQPVLAAVLESVKGPWILVVSPFLLAAGCCAFSLTTNFAWLIAAMAVGSLGSSLFHPQANRAVHDLTNTNRGVVQSTFQVGGNLGMACAPIGVWYLNRFSLHGSWVLLCLAALVGLSAFLLTTDGKDTQDGSAKEAASNRIVPTSPKSPGQSIRTLVAVVTCRALVNSGVVSFLPLYLVHAGRLPHQSLWLVSLVFLAGGALGTWAGGLLNGRLQERKLIQLSFLLSVPLAIVSLYATGAALALCLFVFGVCLMSTFSVTVLYAQKLMPGRAGLASSMVIGLTGGISGVLTVVLGVLADSIGIRDIVIALFALPLVGWVMSLWLPKWEPNTSDGLPWSASHR